VCRTRLSDSRQLKLWPNWRHFAFLTDLDGDAISVDAFNRKRAVARTIRQQLIVIPGRLVKSRRTPVLRGPLNWAWPHWFSRRLAALRAVQPVPG
jgi:hypothetical protein